jgi:hypothetical protein
VTYYTRIAGGPVSSGANSNNEDASKANYGSLFTLITRGNPGLNVSNVIGVFLGTTGLMVGSNFESTVDKNVYLKQLVTIDSYPNTEKWYKVDIRINWEAQTYQVYVNDTLAAGVSASQGSASTPLSFSADDIDGVRLSLYRSVSVFYDEIFLGSDATLSFSCPTTTRLGTVTSATQPQFGWDKEAVTAGASGLATYELMKRHYNFLQTTGIRILTITDYLMMMMMMMMMFISTILLPN